MERINVAELLRNCPSGMKLDSTLVDNLYFDCINDSELDDPYPIQCYTENGSYRTSIRFNEYGHYTSIDNSKCVIFPEGRTTWEGFHRPFEDGDIIYNKGIKALSIFYKQTDDSTISHCFLNILGNFKICHHHSKDISDWEFATEEEKEKLFQAIKKNGYKWNEETKTLEKLIEPIFEVGDVIINTLGKHIGASGSQGVISEITDDKYIFTDSSYILIKNQDSWELVSNKFDITTLKPFESRVLVRNDEHQYWIPAFWGCKRADGYTTTFGWCKYCIPFEGNEHLLETKDDCSEFFKTWK